ncbi:ABC-F family ATP-binding cassette domain-containing protein [Alicyclobacillus cycloheptanicus]|uniref:ATP-binding cassette subfamily F protein uup n=1 Tax=Alicyclobacillus cycloheptanicus TaxID=1457 RepID=A0ABT9XJ74_9BACL|nr:ABC-F family ATP-binding cassette domain-containing protein [Alicyclobacillus cycloheptanicus]MDQ0190364.1 ATP-binding cassette subfamily F protein uup [Alicyclobacillus cycloheptanicus]WDM00001.1 ABC-F family ATP-binding cassette domain-containing protein [Alicyclobacillus cycloheptanicus]
MNLLSVHEIVKTYGEKTLFDQISFGIDEGDRIGLIGVNGAGKSTLLKIAAGVDAPDAGTVTLGGRVTVHYLPQEPSFQPDATVLDQVLNRDRHTSLAEQGAWQLEHEAKAVLTQLGIFDFDAALGSLSGGQRKQIALARALIQPCDLLVLDEPTNHMDDERVAWLAAYLRKRTGALFMVTHDRYFLDSVANRIFELDHAKLYQSVGGYEAFVQAKLARAAQAQASEEKRQNFLRNEQKWIQRGPKARGTKQKARTERYYEILEQQPNDTEQTVEVALAGSRLGSKVIELHHVTKSFDGHPVVDDLSCIVTRGDRIGIVGSNGSGKSTLLKLMAGQLLPDSGSVTIGPTVKIGYFAQEHEVLDGNQRVIAYIREAAESVETADGQRLDAAQVLERFLFPPALQWMPIGKLSGGEKRRLALLRALVSAPNVLLLDEPTNDLDIPTLTVLEAFLADFPGAVVVVSHDRYFLDHVVDKVFACEGAGQISVSTGNYTDYLSKRRDAKPQVSRPEDRPKARPEASSQPEPQPAAGQKSVRKERATLKFTYKEQKEYDEIEDRIAQMEAALAEVLRQMEEAGGDVGRLQTLFEDQQALEARLNELMDRWTYLNERAEEIERSRQM